MTMPISSEIFGILIIIPGHFFHACLNEGYSFSVQRDSILDYMDFKDFLHIFVTFSS